MDKDEALCMALGALEFYYDLYKEKVDANVITAIKEALAQPEQQPVAMRYDFDGYGWLYIDNGSGSNWKEKIKNAEPLYTTPPQRTWIGLTDEEKSDLWCKSTGRNCVNEDTHVFADAIEAKLREKNT